MARDKLSVKANNMIDLQGYSAGERNWSQELGRSGKVIPGL